MSTENCRKNLIQDPPMHANELGAERHRSSGVVVFMLAKIACDLDAVNNIH
jgi:hypothetical protein